LEQLLREFEEQTGGRRYEPLPPRPAPESGRSSRLQFAPPPPAFEPSFSDRIEPLLQPLRARVEQAEMTFAERRLQLDEEHRQRMAQAEAELAARQRELDGRDDLVRARRAMWNVDTKSSQASRRAH
jgi:hypothetical protein